MAFCSFSKDTDNTYTIVENKFITKYLPEADGFAVKVYLYGLYLCENVSSDFSVASMAEVLKCSKEEIRAACKLETTTERGEYGRDSKIIYKADQTGALISVTCIQERGSYYPILKMEFSYETATHNKPAWFNKEDPLQSEGSKIAIVYEIDHGAQIHLTKDTEIKIDLNDFGFVHTIPSFIPTNVHYNRGSSPSSIIIEQWTPETTFSDWFSAKVFFKKGTRPNGDVRKNLYFEGEWEMKDGEPVVKK